jgi:hypothetical protein
MKAIYLLLVLACAQAASAQDYCKLIKKEVSDDKSTFDFSSPFDPAEIPALRVTRSYNNNPDYPSDNFFIIFYTVGNLESIYEKSATGEQLEKQEKRLVVEFDDKTTFIDDSIKIIHDRTVDMLEAIRYIYLPVTDNNLKDFTTKKIAKFSLAGFEQTVPADSANAIMHYVQCIKAVK